MCVISIKVPIRKKSGILSHAPRKCECKYLRSHSKLGSVLVRAASVIVTRLGTARRRIYFQLNGGKVIKNLVLVGFCLGWVYISTLSKKKRQG